jgi:hypothetical protein
MNNDDRNDFEPPQRDPLQFYNVIMVILAWSAVAALSAYIILG